jgi:hypothetical protein
MVSFSGVAEGNRQTADDDRSLGSYLFLNHSQKSLARPARSRIPPLTRSAVANARVAAGVSLPTFGAIANYLTITVYTTENSKSPPTTAWMASPVASALISTVC